jgi:hypothetical protein
VSDKLKELKKVSLFAKFGALVATGVMVSGCAFTMQSMAGQENIAALELAVECRSQEALVIAQQQAASEIPTRALIGNLLLYAIYTEAGDSEAAARAVDIATSDPGMNPDAKATRAEMQESADGVLQGIQDERLKATGQRECS